MADEPEAPEVRFQRELNARVAFEAMLGATLIVAALSAPVYLVFGAASALLDGVFLTRLPQLLVGALSVGAAVFLGGFVGAIALGVPLFLLLERLKLRRAHHYLLGGLLANALVFVVLTGRTPSIFAPAEFLFLAPGVAISFLFLRKIEPVWKASLPPSPGPQPGNVIRLH